MIGQKDTGEKFPWHNIEDEEGDGWVYGQYLRELEIKQNIDFNPDSVDGTPFGTPYAEINGLSKLRDNSQNEKRWFAGDNMQSDGDWKYSAASTADPNTSYLFDAEQRLIGMYHCSVGGKLKG